MLVVFTDGRESEKYLVESVEKEIIRIPEGTSVNYKTLFLFDDVSPLGISYPGKLVEILAQNNQPMRSYDALQLAKKLAPIMPISDKVTVLDGGGVLAYLFLKKAGYKGKACEILKVERTYPDGRPQCRLLSTRSQTPELVIDDILASGQTMSTVLPLSEDEPSPDIACLIASTNITRKSRYREKQLSTIRGAQKLYCAQPVNGLIEINQQFNHNVSERVAAVEKKPAILSLRYLLTKAVDAQDYRQGYLAKKFGGEANAESILDVLKQIDREPIDLLRRNPTEFLRKFGMEVEP